MGPDAWLWILMSTYVSVFVLIRPNVFKWNLMGSYRSLCVFMSPNES